ncbi:hypothetical protein GUJ93_ZPchr0001g31774 [Zizania palustris]|uniref:N-acetyltransferase domain-containing protein n=1 Tax=Zizania palustris TaxID=103762 RepID=A0A8J5UZG6_ZIZPA|nr:hypothetical protein GUJ93_ZPchr0001g31774 [Zizania palustris]
MMHFGVLLSGFLIWVLLIWQDRMYLCCCCCLLIVSFLFLLTSVYSAYYSDICVGAIACRLEKKEGGAVCVYIMTLGVLAPYRGLGIGSKLLNCVLDLCEKQDVPEIYLHVQTNNDDAISFYKKFGFEITKTIEKYYKNIMPPDCYVLTKFIGQAATKK